MMRALQSDPEPDQPDSGPLAEAADPLLGAIHRLVQAQDAVPDVPVADPVSAPGPRAAPPVAPRPVRPAAGEAYPGLETAPAPWPRRLLGALGRQLWRFLRRRDAPRWIAAGLIGLVFLWAPGFIIFLTVFTLLAAVLAYFTLGPDRVQEMVVAWYDDLNARDPVRAERLRRRAASASRWAAAFADRLPARWTSGLHLPDFEPAEAPPEKMRADPFDRIAAEARKHG